jgi:hypothetical protein
MRDRRRRWGKEEGAQHTQIETERDAETRERSGREDEGKKR